jgi:uncharacterized membrane protein
MQLGHLHIAIIHFPIALAIAAAAADLFWWLMHRDFFRHAGLYCLVAAVGITPLALLTGDMLSDEILVPGTDSDFAARIDNHAIMAYVSFGVMIAALGIRVLWGIKPSIKWVPIAYGVLMAALVVSISITADLGGKLKYGEDWFAHLFG